MSGLHRAGRESHSRSTQATAMTALFTALSMQVLPVSLNVLATPAATLFNSFQKKISNNWGVQTEEGTMSPGLHVTLVFCKDLVNWCCKKVCRAHPSNSQRPWRTMGSVDQKKDKSKSCKQREKWFRNMTSFIKIVQLD